MFFNAAQLNKIIGFSLEAGEIAKKYFFAKNFEIKSKADGTKVTTADLEISVLLQKKLLAEFPQIPVVCEENNMSEINSDIFWLIDPIDGTNSFIDGNVEFVINIALVKDKKAIFGLIYAPLFEGGKMVFLDCEDRVILRDGSGDKVLEPKKNFGEVFKVVVSPRAKEGEISAFVRQFLDPGLRRDDKGEGMSNDAGLSLFCHPGAGWDPGLCQWQNIEIIRLSSAAKFIKLLTGEVDFYLHLRKSMEWDTAAGQALIEAMGGFVKDLFFNEEKSLIGENMTYKKPNFSNPTFIAKIYG